MDTSISRRITGCYINEQYKKWIFTLECKHTAVFDQGVSKARPEFRSYPCRRCAAKEKKS